jgi:three-Cys-motif partner protein
MPKVVTGDDGLPMTEVGTWTLDKHKRLEKYVHITRYVRRRFAKSAATYIELFCGPGRSFIEDTSEIIEGSAIIAAQTAKDGGYPYTDIHLADADKSFVEAACKRMPRGVGHVHPYVGDAERTVNDVAPHLNKHGLHFAFLDPYGLDPLSFSILEKLAAFKHMDMLIHVSILDFQRNLRRYMKEEAETLERFAPGWRNAGDQRELF